MAGKGSECSTDTTSGATWLQQEINRTAKERTGFGIEQEVEGGRLVAKPFLTAEQRVRDSPSQEQGQQQESGPGMMGTGAQGTEGDQAG